MKKWVAALRSGEYKQTKEQLRFGDSFCCLGVACDLAREDLGIDWKGGTFDTHSSYLPELVTKLLGGITGGAEDKLNITLPKTNKIAAEFGGKSLIGFNDRGATFSQIADIIEEQFLGAE